MSSSEHYGRTESGVEWATPVKYYAPLKEAIEGFDLDPASGAEETPIADYTFTKEENGLAQDWFGDVWVNPPYSKQENPKWADKIAYEATRDDVTSITALVPAATDTQWFQTNYAQAEYLTFVEGRINFNGSDNSASFANVIASFGEFNQAYVEGLQGIGFVAQPRSDGPEQSREWF